MTTLRARLAALPRNVWAVTFTSLLTDISSEMIVYLLPLFLANVLGVRTSVIGLIEGVAETTSSLLKLFSGWWSDRLGRRKGLTLAGYSLSAFAKPFLLLVQGWPGVLAVRFADRAGKGIRTSPRDALVADSVPAERRGFAFGIHRAGDTFGAFLGVGVALVIVLATQSDTVELSRDTFNLVVLLSLIPAVLGVLVLALVARETRRPPDPNAGPPRLAWKTLPPQFRRFILVLILFTLGNSTDSFIILRAQSLGVSVTATLLMVMTFNLVYTLISGPAGALSDRIGRKRLLVVGWGVYALVYLGFALANAGWQVWALYGVYGLYYALTEGAAKAYVADLTPSAQRGTAYGVMNAAIGLMALPASLVAGILWQGIGGWTGFGPAAPFLFGAVLAGVAGVGLMQFRGETSVQA
jgi:MFS family permease